MVNTKSMVGYNGWRNTYIRWEMQKLIDFLSLLQRYNQPKKVWIMRHVGLEAFSATCKASETSLVLGSHKWTVHNDSEKCSPEGGSYITTLHNWLQAS